MRHGGESGLFDEFSAEGFFEGLAKVNSTAG
jgi:hypothetical protein